MHYRTTTLLTINYHHSLHDYPHYPPPPTQEFRRLLRMLARERPLPATYLVQGAGSKIRLCALSASMMRMAQLLQAGDWGLSRRR